jgi:hypothetical protein
MFFFKKLAALKLFIYLCKKKDMKEKLEQLKKEYISVNEQAKDLLKAYSEELNSYFNIVFPKVEGCRFDISANQYRVDIRLSSNVGREMGTVRLTTKVLYGETPKGVELSFSVSSINPEKDFEFMGLYYIGLISKTIFELKKTIELDVCEIFLKHYDGISEFLAKNSSLHTQLDRERTEISKKVASEIIKGMKSEPLIVKDFMEKWCDKVENPDFTLKTFKLNTRTNRLQEHLKYTMESFLEAKIVESRSKAYRLELKAVSGVYFDDMYVKEEDLLREISRNVYLAL